jgi:hypothetical protein
MMYLSSAIGAAILGALVFGIWPEMWMSYGIFGGWTAATILVSIGWYMNHRLGVIHNPAGQAWVDMGWAVGAAGVGWALVRFYPDCQFSKAVPTLVCCLIGGGIAGVLAELVKRRNRNFEKQ